MLHNQFYVLCVATIYKGDREQAQEGLLEEAVLEGGEGNSQKVKNVPVNQNMWQDPAG